MAFENKRILITGAGGFIGSHLVEELAKTAGSVRAMVHYNSAGSWGNLELLPKDIQDAIEIFTGDVADPFSVAKAVDGCDVVFHLAALIGIPYSYIAPQSYVMTNVIGTLNILQACLDAGVEKVVHTSTSETYGTAVYTPIDEDHPLKGQSPYSAGKIGADKLAESYFLSFGLPVATVRPFNTYGPRQSARAVIPTIISQALEGKESLKLGSLTPVRDLTFVKDTVRGFILAAQSTASAGELVNIGFGKGITIGDLAEIVIKLIGKDVRIVCDEARVRPTNSEVMELVCANAKAKQLIGWEPRYSLEEGLKETIGFIEANLDRFKSDLYNV